MNDAGWWGISRHAHYATELLLSLMWTVPTGLAVLPYFYVAYLFVLLVDRAYRDDLRCRAKYAFYIIQSYYILCVLMIELFLTP